MRVTAEHRWSRRRFVAPAGYVRGTIASRALVSRETLVAGALVGGVPALTVIHAVTGP